MTYTLLGRWQTRLLTHLTAGLLISLILGVATQNISGVLTVLIYWVVLGLGWDVIYTGVQKIRWNRDWPIVYQLLGGLLEGWFLWQLITDAIEQALLPDKAQFIAEDLYFLQYTLIFLVVFILTQGPLRVLFPKWRFNGGRIL